jgi:hypothetical protein
MFIFPNELKEFAKDVMGVVRAGSSFRMELHT